MRIVEAPERTAYQPLSWSLRAWRVGAEDQARTLSSAWPWQHSPDAKGEAELALQSSAGVAWLTDRAGRGESAAALVLAEKPTNADGSWPIPGRLREGAKQPCFGISSPDAKVLREWLAAGSRVRVAFELDGETRKAPVRTVLARIPRARAEASPGPRTTSCSAPTATRTSAGPGADDNASGVATVLEIASAWQRAITAGEVPAPPHEIRFAIWPEISSTADYLATRVPRRGACWA